MIVSCIALVCLAMGLAAESAKAEETEILKITVGKSTLLGSEMYQNTSVVMVSRTGIAAVLYVTGRRDRPMEYRVSTDDGETWSKEISAPHQFGGGPNSGALFPGAQHPR